MQVFSGRPVIVLSLLTTDTAKRWCWSTSLNAPRGSDTLLNFENTRALLGQRRFCHVIDSRSVSRRGGGALVIDYRYDRATSLADGEVDLVTFE